MPDIVTPLLRGAENCDRFQTEAQQQTHWAVFGPCQAESLSHHAADSSFIPLTIHLPSLSSR